MQLAALSLRGLDAPAQHAFVAAFSGDHRDYADYLSDEVLRQLAPNVRNFLFVTSPLTRLCAPLCDAMLAAVDDGVAPAPGDSQALLETIERRNLFCRRSTPTAAGIAAITSLPICCGRGCIVSTQGWRQHCTVRRQRGGWPPATATPPCTTRGNAMTPILLQRWRSSLVYRWLAAAGWAPFSAGSPHSTPMLWRSVLICWWVRRGRRCSLGAATWRYKAPTWRKRR